MLKFLTTEFNKKSGKIIKDAYIKMYTIEINYTTGSSISSYVEIDTIGYQSESKEELRLLLSYIEKHNEMCLKLNNSYRYSRIKKEDILNLYSKEPWFVVDYPPQSILFNDRLLACFWIGYFETIHYAKIIAVNKEEDKDCIYF